MQPFITHTGETLGYAISFAGPATAADLDELAGREGFCLSEALKQYMYQVRYPAFRDAFAKAVEAESGVPRKKESGRTHAKTGETLSDKYSETEQNYINRISLAPQPVLDAEGKETGQTYQLDASKGMEIAMRVNAELGDYTYDPSSERKPAQPFYAQADEIIAKRNNGVYNPKGGDSYIVDTLEKKGGFNFTQAFGDFATNGQINRDNLARAFKAIKEKQDRDLKTAL